MSKLSDLENELAEAVAQLRAAEDREAMASRETTARRDKVNDAQKKFDELVREIRSTAPRSTDWKATRGVSEASR